MLRGLITIEEARKNPIALWLMACYAYEELDNGIMTDAVFDQLSVYLDEDGLFLSHPHAYLIDLPMMSMGSAMSVTKPRNQWPTIIFGATHDLLDSIYGKGKWGDVGQSYREKLRSLIS